MNMITRLSEKTSTQPNVPLGVKSDMAQLLATRAKQADKRAEILHDVLSVIMHRFFVACRAVCHPAPFQTIGV